MVISKTPVHIINVMVIIFSVIHKYKTKNHISILVMVFNTIMLHAEHTNDKVKHHNTINTNT